MATQIAVRLSDKERKEFEQNTAALGLSPQSAIRMFISQFNYDKGFSQPMTRKNSRENLIKEFRKAYADAPVVTPKSDEELRTLFDED